ncbi:CBS domain-containing protein [Shinella sp.]|uniref:CBS domain-containing protein n=1 Tax=Shinella sp. TaxID=1870904 RepID=UPI0029AF2CE8|nr:CBS domain-containing protein [Shinella sp.]MDX3972517.1 CBS domain-containing protein [Shinella sp.]
MLAKDLMTAHPHSVTPDTSVKTAIELLLHERISGVPVVDDNGTVCGILTEGDLLRRSIFSVGATLVPQVVDATFFADYIRSHGTTVGDCMTRDVFCVSPDQPLSQLVALMRDRGIKRVPVVADGTLVGIVSRYDVLKAISMGRDSIAEGDDALQLAVTTRLYSELGLSRDTVEVRVHRGIAELTDSGDEPSKRRAMEIVAESVAGVAGVKFRPA